jgi:Transposase DDE domain
LLTASRHGSARSSVALAVFLTIVMSFEHREEPPSIDREFGSRVVHRLRRRASEREDRRAWSVLVAGLRKKYPAASEQELLRRAEAGFAALKKRDPGVAEALERLEPSSRAPDRNGLYPGAELAAAVAQPSVARRLCEMAKTPSTRGPTSELSGAVAALVHMAGRTGANIARESFDALTSSPEARWALAQPKLERSRSQRYRNIVTITGRTRPGHDPYALLVGNLELIAELQSLREPTGEYSHPHIGKVGIVDATRLHAPVAQFGPVSGEHLEQLRRPGMSAVSSSTYKRGDQYDTVIGWKAFVIADQATTLPLVWAVAPGNAYEPTVLLDTLLPLLFELWPECPMEALVGDGAYDTREVCQTLEERNSLHPVFSPRSTRERVEELRRDRTVPVVNGQPSCPCGPMKFRGREGFYELEKRLRDGKARGVMAPGVKDARIRWACPNKLHDEVSLKFRNDPTGNTYLPRGGDSRAAYHRRALEIYRNQIESVFSGVKRACIGTDDARTLWVRDNGIEWLLGSYLLLHTAKRLAHENGDYGLFHDEFQELGLDSAGDPPSMELIAALRARRPERLRWQWPKPGRANVRRDRHAA